MEPTYPSSGIKYMLADPALTLRYSDATITTPHCRTEGGRNFQTSEKVRNAISDWKVIHEPFFCGHLFFGGQAELVRGRQWEGNGNEGAIFDTHPLPHTHMPFNKSAL